MKSIPRVPWAVLCSLGCCFAFLGAPLSEGGSAAWSGNPTSGDWNTATNWTPATVPNGPGDTATFSSSTVVDLSLSAGVEVDGIVFEASAGAFTVSTNPGVALTMSGVGVTNSSGVRQNFVNTANSSNSGSLFFTNSATAGDSVVYTNETPRLDGQSALIQFEDSSSAGSAQFINEAASFESHAGIIEFQGDSTAANGTFRNTGFADEEFPIINFRDQASAGQGIFTNEVEAEGEIVFYDSSTAGDATFTNESAFDSAVYFHDNATAGNATIINEGGVSNEGGSTIFYDHSTAGNATFTVDGSMSDFLYDGNASLQFNTTASAGTGTFTVNGSEFAGEFAYGGLIFLDANSTADHGVFRVNGGKVSGAMGGIVYLDNSATAGAATFYANGAAVDGALGGRVRFDLQTPTAANSTLIATAGIGDNEGAGGGILFAYEATGGQARVEVFGNGFLDLRALDLAALTIGSLEGDGLVFLGGVNLSVGSNNLDTTFAGVIEENSDGATGALTKIGTGTITLTGASTYTGGTTITSGKLLLGNRTGSATGSGPVQVKGGRLGGRGTIGGDASFETGATLMPGEPQGKPGTIAILGQLTFNDGSAYHCGLNSKTTVADKVAGHGVTINQARFDLFDHYGLKLPAGAVFTAISNTASTPISGTFTNLTDGGTITVGQNTFQASYEGGDGNDLTLTVVQ